MDDGFSVLSISCKLFFLITVFLFTGCVSGKVSKRYYLLPVDLQVAYQRMEIGKTTMSDIEGWLGKPYISTKDNLKRDKWIYLAPEVAASRMLLEITFNDDHIAIDKRLDTTGGGDGLSK